MRKALSIRQPWAWLIVNGFKPFENRTWSTALRGDIYIHASLQFDKEGYARVQQIFPEIAMPAPDDFERGGIVGVATIIGVVSESTSLWFTGPLAFAFGGAAPLPFRPLPGRLGFFNVPEEAPSTSLSG